MSLKYLALSLLAFTAICAATALADHEYMVPAATPNPGLRYYYDVPQANPPERVKVDVCVYGATPGGVGAAVQAGRMGKTVALPDCNNAGPFSTDFVGANYGWPDGDYAARERIFQAHVTYQQGLLWFLAHDEAVPQRVRAFVRKFGLPKDEFPETGGWPHELYVREARRMVSDYVMTQRDCSGKRVAPDSVGLGSYTMDSHHTSRVVVEGKVLVEGDMEHLQGKMRPYPISYRAIVPRQKECENLLVPVCLSSTHVAFGSIRMEPVFMILGQSAGTAAALAINAGVPVQKLDYASLRKRLLADGQLLQ